LLSREESITGVEAGSTSAGAWKSKGVVDEAGRKYKGSVHGVFVTGVLPAAMTLELDLSCRRSYIESTGGVSSAITGFDTRYLLLA
jgi:hypothetical protein